MPETRASRMILVVDPDDGARTSVCRTLQESGYAAVPARDAGAMQWYGDGLVRPDLVIAGVGELEAADYHLGLALDGFRNYAPVITMSIFARQECVARGLVDSRAPYLRKPCPPGTLVRAVKATLATWRPPVLD